MTGTGDEIKKKARRRRTHSSDEQTAVISPYVSAPDGRVGPFRQHQSFTVISVHQLIEKLRWDISDLQRLQRADSLANWRQVVSYRAIDCALSAWHLAEWFARDVRATEPRSRLRQFLSINDNLVDLAIYSRDIEDAAIKLCPDLDICRVIAIASKHYDVENSPRSDIRTDCFMRISNGSQVMALTVWIGDEPRDFVQILTTCLRFWERVWEVANPASKWTPSESTSHNTK